MTSPWPRTLYARPDSALGASGSSTGPVAGPRRWPAPGRNSVSGPRSMSPLRRRSPRPGPSPAACSARAPSRRRAQQPHAVRCSAWGAPIRTPGVGRTRPGRSPHRERSGRVAVAHPGTNDPARGPVRGARVPSPRSASVCRRGSPRSSGAPVPTAGSGVRGRLAADRDDQEVACLVVEQPREYRRTVETRQTQPVHRPGAGHQRSGATIRQQSVLVSATSLIGWSSPQIPRS